MSAGILLFRVAEGRLEVLLGHPGGPFFRARDEGAWSILKGEVDEETGSPAPDRPPLALGSVVQKGGKVVWAWALEGDLDPGSAVSNTFEMQWPPGSGRMAEFPEIDRVAWFAPAHVRWCITPAQAAFIDRLEELLGPEKPEA